LAYLTALKQIGNDSGVRRVKRWKGVQHRVKVTRGAQGSDGERCTGLRLQGVQHRVQMARGAKG
jgi:hypothetical protein